MLRFLATALLLLLAPSRLAAQRGTAATSDVFRRYADRVLKVQVVETGSAAKATIGSGFYATAGGHVHREVAGEALP